MARQRKYHTEEEALAAKREAAARSRARTAAAGPDRPKRSIRPKAATEEERLERRREWLRLHREKARRLAGIGPRTRMSSEARSAARSESRNRYLESKRPQLAGRDNPNDTPDRMDAHPRSSRTEDTKQKARDARAKWKARKAAGIVRPHRKFSSDEERTEHQRNYMREYCRDYNRRHPERLRETREKTKLRLRDGRPARVPMSPEERAARKRAYKATHAKGYTRKATPKTPKLKVGRRKGDHYVDNAELLAEVVLSRTAGELTPRAWEMMMLISEEAAKKLYYADPRDRQDCVQQARIEMFKYWRGFDPEKSSNAFAYFTEMAKNGYARGWEILHPKKYKGTIRTGFDADSLFNL